MILWCVLCEVMTFCMTIEARNADILNDHMAQWNSQLFAGSKNGNVSISLLYGARKTMRVT